ncbi:MAG: TetR/AcrR family transcriptional regulator, partial [Mycobacterium sp.]|nr:TetR/AcrR family transcriptional regulator [Mycobacterium sp.]
MSRPVPIRQDKTRQTRQLIEECAVRLFAERGYDHVSMAEIAQWANVAPATVFNHFPTKDALIFNGLERFESGLLDAIVQRNQSDSIPQAFRTYVLAIHGSLTSNDPDTVRRLRTIAAIIDASPALLSAEQQIYGHYTDRLATLIAEDTQQSDSLQAWVIANALMGVHRALVRYVRTAMLADASPARVTREVRRIASVVFAQLDR